MKTLGPTITVRKSCGNCPAMTVEITHYEDGNSFDSDHDHYCNHSSVGKKYFGQSSETPIWCPITETKE